MIYIRFIFLNSYFLAECKINKDGSITTSDLALAVYVEGKGVVGTLDLLKEAKFVKTTSTAKAKSHRAARK